MTEEIKNQIRECVAAVNALSAQVETVSSRAITELPKENITLGIHMMDLKKLINQAKAVSERIEWSINK